MTQTPYTPWIHSGGMPSGRFPPQESHLHPKFRPTSNGMKTTVIYIYTLQTFLARAHECTYLYNYIYIYIYLVLAQMGHVKIHVTSGLKEGGLLSDQLKFEALQFRLGKWLARDQNVSQNNYEHNYKF